MEKIKQVIIVHYTLPPVIGGVEKMLEPLAEQLAQNNFIVTFLAGKGNLNSQKIKTSLIPELNPGHTKIAGMQKQIESGSIPEHFETKVDEIERKIETKIGYIKNVVIHNMMSMPHNLAATQALWNFMQKYPDKNYYIWTHDLAWKMESYQEQLFERRPWSLLKEPVPQGQYITVSESRQNQIVDLLGISKSKIKVVPNVIKFTDFLHFNESTSRVVKQLSLYNRFPVIMLPVRLLPRKNIPRAVKILSKLKDYYPDFVAIITGDIPSDNPQGKECYDRIMKIVEENRIQENIIFLHNVFKKIGVDPGKNPVIVRDLYFLSHLVLYLSSDEGFGIPILESAVSRTPIVLSDIKVFQDIAGNNANYLPAKLSDSEAAEELHEILMEKSEYLQLNREVARRYNWEFWWDRHLKDIFN